MLAALSAQIREAGLCYTLFVGVLVYYILDRCLFRLRYDWHKIPGPPTLPIIGDLLSFLYFGRGERKVHEFAYYWWKKLGKPKVLRRSILWKRNLVVFDPAFAQYELTSNHGLPKSPTYNLLAKLFGPTSPSNMFLRKTTDEKWRAIRKAVAPAFSTENMKRIFPNMVSKVDTLMAEIGDLPQDQPIDIQSFFVQLTFDVISSCGMGIETNAIKSKGDPFLDAQFACANDIVRDAVNPFRALFKKLFPFSGMAQTSDAKFAQLYGEVDKLVERMKSQGPPQENDYRIGSCLLRADTSNLAEPLTEEELKSEASLFFFAGTDSTARQISWLLCCIASHPKVQNKLYSELVDAGLCGAGGRDLEFGDLSKLPYLNAVVKEAMRVLPAASLGTSRYLEEDTKILGYKVPKNTVVVAYAFTLNRSSELYDNPDAFNPDRWINNELPTQQYDGKSGSRLLWTFSHGPRDCIGQRMAIMEMQILLVMLLGRFEIKLGESMGGWEGVLQKKFDKVLCVCKGGMWVQFGPRE